MICYSKNETLNQLLIKNINAILVVSDCMTYIEFNVLEKDNKRIKKFIN